MDDAHDLPGGVGHLFHGAHGEINLLDIFRSAEVAGDGVGNEDGLILDLRIPQIRNGLFENADDGERNAGDFEGLSDGGVVAAEAALSKKFTHHGALGVGGLVFFVEEAAVRYEEVADVLVLWADAEDQRIFGDAAAEADAVV